MAGISFTTLSKTTEPLLAHSAASHATRKALRAAMAALAVAGDKGPVLHAGIALKEGAEISGAVTKLKSGLEAVVRAPVQADYDPILQKAAQYLLYSLQTREREDFWRCEALYHSNRMTLATHRLRPTQAMARGLLAEWAWIAAHMARGQLARPA